MLRIIRSLIFFAAAVLLLIKLQGNHSDRPHLSAADRKGVAMDIALPSLPLKNDAGATTTVDAKTLGGKVTVINFFASWCAPCKAEMPELVKLHQASGVQFQGIAWNDTPQVMHDWLKMYGNPFDTVWYDTTGDGAAALEIHGVPETFVVDKHGRIVYRITGVVTPDVASERLIPLLKQLNE